MTRGDPELPPAVVVMGVCGAGKTTVGRALAAARGAALVEGDDFHPPTNVGKMRRGEALNDADRRPWLTALAAEIGRRQVAGEAIIVTCSALRRRYRDILRAGTPGAVRFAYLKVSRAEAAVRMAARSGHFMPAGLVPSQFAALEEPMAEQDAITVDGALAPESIVADLLVVLAEPTAERPLDPR